MMTAAPRMIARTPVVPGCFVPPEDTLVTRTSGAVALSHQLGPAWSRGGAVRPGPGVRHKVLLFIPHLQQGGAERQILELMRRLPPRYAPSLCLYRHDDGARHHYEAYLPPGEPRHALGVDSMGPVGLRRLIELLRAERPAIVHSYRDKANLWARLAALVAPVPVVLTSVRTRFQGPLYTAAEFLLQTRSDRVLTNSRGIEEELVHWAGVAPHRIQIINNFIDLEEFRPPTPEERAAAR